MYITILLATKTYKCFLCRPSTVERNTLNTFYLLFHKPEPFKLRSPAAEHEDYDKLYEEVHSPEVEYHIFMSQTILNFQPKGQSTLFLYNVLCALSSSYAMCIGVNNHEPNSCVSLSISPNTKPPLPSICR